MAGNSIVPYQWHDWIPASLKIAFKRLVCADSDAYQIIVGGGAANVVAAGIGGGDVDEVHGVSRGERRHADWALGIQPDRVIMRRLAERYQRIKLISIVSRKELIISGEELAREWPNCSREHLQWYDHSICSPFDGRNQALAPFKRLLAAVHSAWLQRDHDLFYCHCMAGRGRSFLFLLAWLLFYGDQASYSLQYSAPNLAELSDFVATLRPQVFRLQGLEGEQRGFAGLLALDWLANQTFGWWRQRDLARLQTDLQCVGLALSATLDNTYRTTSDLQTQQVQAVQLFSLAKSMQIRGDVLELLLWTPPWQVACGDEEVKNGLIFDLSPATIAKLKQQRWANLPAVARANWPRWKYWWVTAG